MTLHSALTLHSDIGLDVPEGECWIEVAEERREWRNNKALVFDTSFRHSTFNSSTKDRIVLIIDFWHPEVTQAEQQMFEYVYDLRNKIEGGVIKIPEKKSWWKLS